MRSPFRLTPEILLRAYQAGIFPMAESADDPELFWVDPERRGILPLDAFHVPRRLQRVVRQDRFEVRVDGDFAGTAERPAPRADREAARTCVDQQRDRPPLYRAPRLRAPRTAWSAGWKARWSAELYGVSIGGAFFGESMFSRVADASKVALVHLVALMRVGGYRLLDLQFVTPHLSQFGAIEVPRAQYHRLLADALRYRAVFPREVGRRGTGPSARLAPALAALALQPSKVTS